MRFDKRCFRSQWYLIWCLIGAVVFTVWPGKSFANDLAVGRSAKAEYVDVAITSARDFNFKTRAELFALRIGSIQQHPELLNHAYRPDQATFGLIVDKRPWWGDIGQAYYGPGQNSIKGKSLESRFFLNPYLLVGDRMSHGLPTEKITEVDLARRSYETYLQPSNLRWWPKSGKAEVTYDLSGFKSRYCSMFDYSNLVLKGTRGLSLVNARDLGLKYVFIPPSWAYNCSVGVPMTAPMPIPHYIHCGNSCGYPGGCNNQSPATPWLDSFSIEKVPARISLMFWKNPPKTGREPPDMTYTLNYR
ncbi:MAG: hypothetical protein K2X93_29545 [Candidatus Obscuribacterales bacterium]|nr:hypothetical protein [Candidatus Obscuribacterales bacterium]